MIGTNIYGMSVQNIIVVGVFALIFQIFTADLNSILEGSLCFAHLLGGSCIVCAAEHPMSVLPITR